MKNPLIYFLFIFVVTLGTSCDDEPDVDDGGSNVEELPLINISNLILPEGNTATTTFRFKVSTSEASTKAVSVDYATEEKTAGIGIDFEEAIGTLTIPAGETEGFIEVSVVTDTLKEEDEEFEVKLSNPVNAQFLTSSGSGTIRNDDTFVFVPEDGYITPENYTGFNLVWGDEFDGNQLNPDDYTYEQGAGGWGNQESQIYTNRSENSYLSDGNLVIEAREENFNGSNYTSARIITQSKKIFAFGRIDIRAILPEGQGIWPALWMLGEDFGTIGWPACGELDIMELLGHEPGTVHGTAHWGPQGQSFSTFKGNEYSLNGGEKFSDEYHVFSLIWEPNSVRWLVDDVQYHSITTADVNGTPYPFNDEFFFIFNIAVGGQWPGYPDASTQFPQRMFIDYVRVFQEN